MPSPLGHAMAGVAVAWIAEIITRDVRKSGSAEPPSRETPSFAARAVQSVTPLAVACGVLAIAPDFDIFFHTHRTYSHSLGAAAIVWVVAAAAGWAWGRANSAQAEHANGERAEHARPLLIATVCGAAYASHVLLDWLGTDLGRHAGLMALWPFTDAFYRSGLNLFFEIVPPHRVGVVQAVLVNAPAIARELLVLGPIFLLTWSLRIHLFPLRLDLARWTNERLRRDEGATP